MNYTFCSIRINVTKHDVTFATKWEAYTMPIFPPNPVATPLIQNNQSL